MIVEDTLTTAAFIRLLTDAGFCPMRNYNTRHSAWPPPWRTYTTPGEALYVNVNSDLQIAVVNTAIRGLGIDDVAPRHRSDRQWPYAEVLAFLASARLTGHL